MITVSAAGKRYGQAFFTLAREHDVIETLQSDLERLIYLWEEEKDLKGLLYHPRITRDAKKEVLSRLGEDSHPLTANLLLLLADKGRLTLLPEIGQVFAELKDVHYNIMPVEVRVARPLPQDLEERLLQKLQKATGKDIQLEVKVDQSIIGGMVLKVGDILIDGSLQRGLEKLREQLSRIQVSQIGVNNG